MKYLLFEYSKDIKTPIQISGFYEIKVFSPSAKKLYASFERERFFRKSLFRTYISLLTKGRTQIVFVLDENKEVVHSSVVIPPNIKYPFLNKGDYCIGPCNTIPSERGKGIYPFILQYIVNQNETGKYYMIIKDDNQASINGVKKAGFILSDKIVEQTRLLNRFVIVNSERNN